MKTCNKCGETKPTTEFHTLKMARDGLYPSCRVCRNRHASEAAKQKSVRLQAAKRADRESRAKERPALDRPLIVEAVKSCWGCSQRKATSEFAPLTGRPTDRNNYCDDCRPRVAGKKPWFLYKYGISVADYESLFQKQQGRCAICGTDKPPVNKRGIAWHLDHCHRTGRVRGILCHFCNTALGGFQDDARKLREAVRYLECPPSVGLPPQE